MRLGVDVGGTKVEVVALEEGHRVASSRVVTGHGNTGVVESVLTAVAGLLAEPGLHHSAIESVGVGIPGVVDLVSGRVTHAVNLGVEDLALGPILAARLGVEVRVDNDVNAACLGAYHLLKLSGSMAYLNLGTGLAAGLVLDGQLWHGSRGSAGEIGHISLDPNGPVCACGQHGCLEVYASGSGLARAWPTHDLHPTDNLFDAADAGDPRAIVVRDTFVRAVADAVSILVLTLDVDSVVIGGGLSNLGGRLMHPLARELTERAGCSAFLAGLGIADRLRLASHGSAAPAVGAALIGAGSQKKLSSPR
ncbi:Sugar kinase of the NBD/HSP70 family, may contain an N-terminal HTH domain [Propionibacterium cyclohexanicum]|uniref:Sugar kinase of the NBD/HSP70 family, may contain an N-terminal HTH domain n=1 Tax=Propionibacterium cyclohexanicum TaxID=64702 RepID=A0A1H9TIF2_9ACTN|nr:ROK family protein [Propionibacterium cyclohexanicum]SER96403.1 Sugar kinase of the NBD/HSP70 family, may contain an N-terminal HTH domain [Propionibacterium cyclohexanicum]